MEKRRLIYKTKITCNSLFISNSFQKYNQPDNHLSVYIIFSQGTAKKQDTGALSILLTKDLKSIE